MPTGRCGLPSLLWASSSAAHPTGTMVDGPLPVAFEGLNVQLPIEKLAEGQKPPLPDFATLQDESRRELIFSQIVDRKFKDEASTKAMAMIDE